MNHQMGHPQQGHHMGGQPPPPPPHHQNAGQQRQVPNGQQQFHAPNGHQQFQGANGPHQFQGQNQMKGAQGQQAGQNQFTLFDPQLLMFTFEKPRNSDSWENSRPEQQPFATEKIRKLLEKLQADQSDPTTAIDKVPSTNCRRNIFALVKDQNVKLQAHNKKLEWTIAAIKISLHHDRGFMGMPTRQQLKRVKVILETGPSAFQAPQQVKLGGQATGMQNPNMSKQPNIMAQNQAPSAQQNMNGGQQQRPMQQPPQPHTGQRMQAVQYPEQQPTRMTQHPNQVQGHAAGPNAPPPPPPPQPHPAMMDAPPPPPQMLREPHMQHPNHPPPPPQPARPQSRGPMHDMPGTFPPDVRRPNHRPFSEEDEDPRVLRAKKTRRKGSQVPSSSSSSSSSTSSTDSDAWESDSASSSPDHVRVRNVDEGYGYVEGHKRGRSHKQKKSRKDKSHRKAKGHHQSRSRSQSRNRGKAFRKRRDSGMIESPVISRRNSFSSKDNSPRLAHAQPNIHIHIDPNKVTEERVRDHDEARERRTGHSSSPTGHRKDPRRNEKLNGGHRMSRENSVDDGSGTDSYATSSAHTGSDSIFDKPERRLSVSQRRSHQKPYSLPQGGFNNPHPSHLYDDLDDVPSARYHHADDYPYNSTTKHDSYFKQPSYNMRPDLPHRRNTTGNPFDTTFFPPKPLRTSTFAAGMHGASFPFQQKRQSSEREEQEELRREFAEYLNFKREARDSQKRYTEREDVVERDLRDFNAHEYAEFLDWKKNNYSARRAPPLKRSSTDRHDLGMYNDDDFELRYSTTRRSPYNSFDRI